MPLAEKALTSEVRDIIRSLESRAFGHRSTVYFRN